jgi:glycine/D-amino acid oxidase-like deaminating enzyme/nitrite reductase/ring-hydroxylating ferredoxin subunit/DMSO/TMAO reductase YedYZ heme-binding membrane subunit
VARLFGRVGTCRYDMRMQASLVSPWLKSTPDQQRYPRLIGTHEADVVVVGAGITGVMTAWYLAEKGADVVLLEKNHVATGDTGFTTAFVTRVPDVPMPVIAKKHGLPYVQQLFKATKAAQDSLRSLVEQHEIDCDWHDCNAYNGAYKSNDRFLKDEWEVVRQADPSAEFITDKQLLESTPMVEAIKYPNEARFDVRKFIFGLLKTSTAKKIKIFEDSEVLSMNVGDEVVLTTEHGEVQAKKAVFATGMPPHFMAELYPLFKPQITYALSAKYKGTLPISDDIFWDSDEPYQYYRRNEESSIILGGADHAPGAAQTGDQSLQALEKFLKKYLPGEATIEQRWSGSLFYTEDGVPFAAAHPHYKGKVLVASGLGGNGMVMGTMIGGVCADLALEQPNRHAELFTFSRVKTRIATPTPQQKKAAAAPSAEKKNPAVIRIFQILLPLIFIAVLIFPAYFFFSQRGGIGFLADADFQTTSILLFPLVGLYAFTLLWVQVMLGSSMVLFRKVFPWIEKFHHAEGVFVLLFALLHPSLLFLGYGPAGYLSYDFVIPEQKLFVYLGQVQLFLMILTVATALLRKSRWLQKKWHYVHFLNYVVFISAWTHSWFLGSDVRTTGLRYVWIFFGLTFLASGIARLVRGIRARSQWDQLAAAETSTDQGSETAATFKKVATSDQLSTGKPLCVTVDGKQLVLFKQENNVYAIDNACSHAGGPLCKGKLDGTIIQCPLHGSRFNITTGAVLSPPATRPVRSYKVRKVGNSIEVEL